MYMFYVQQLSQNRKMSPNDLSQCARKTARKGCFRLPFTWILVNFVGASWHLHVGYVLKDILKKNTWISWECSKGRLQVFLWLVWYGYGWCSIPTLIRNINRYSHMGRCPFQEYQWKVSELYKMTIPEPKNAIFPVTNRAYLAAGAGCWLFVPSTYQCKTVPTI